MGSLCPDYPSAITEGNKIRSSVRVSPGHSILPTPASVKVTTHILRGLTVTREQKPSDSAENVLSGPQRVLQETFPDLQCDSESPTSSEAEEWAVRKMNGKLGHGLAEGRGTWTNDYIHSKRRHEKGVPGGYAARAPVEVLVPVPITPTQHLHPLVLATCVQQSSLPMDPLLLPL